MQLLHFAVMFIMFVLVITLGFAIMVTWRKLRRLEAYLTESNERHAHGELLLHEFLAELEQAGNSLLSRIGEREQQLFRSLESGQDANPVEHGQDALQHDPIESQALPTASGATSAPPLDSAWAPDKLNESTSTPAEAKRARGKIDEIQRLAVAGHSAQDIARMLHVGSGEVELILEVTRLRRRNVGT